MTSKYEHMNVLSGYAFPGCFVSIKLAERGMSNLYNKNEKGKKVMQKRSSIYAKVLIEWEKRKQPNMIQLIMVQFRQFFMKKFIP